MTSTVAVSVADMMTPLGVAVWVLYVIPLALCLFVRRPAMPVFLAVGITASTMTKFILATHSDQERAWLAEINRPLFAVVIWSMAIVARRFILARGALQREQWLQTGRSVLAERVRGEHTATEIAARALGLLSEHTGALAAAFYAVEGDALLRLATRALPPDGDRAGPARLGEGLTGQAAADGKVVLVSDVPPDFMRLTSALGEARPRHVIIAPTSAEGHVNGVIELGYLDAVGADERELLEQVAELLGMALRSAAYRRHLEELLEETQRQTEELASQQEEMRAANHELEAQRRELLVAQEALTANADALAKASRYKSEFLANMSHELRTPLNSALILARLLAENKERNLSPDQIRYAETIHGAGRDLLTLIDEILDLSKIEAGRIEAQPELVPIDRVTAGLDPIFRPVAEGKKLSFRVDVAEDAPRELYTDPHRLQQILKNLLSNALKFTDRGEVSLRVRAEGEGRVAFAVEDTGIGIPEAQQGVIFEAFRQADGTTSRRYGGTGLGLSISRELARLLGGDITVESAEGRGSRFQLSIPARIPPARRAEPAIAEPPARLPSPRPPRAPAPAAEEAADPAGDGAARARTGRAILVIGDDPRVAGLLDEVARERGFGCLAARSAEEGLAFVRRHAPDGVLLDAGLPDGSGLAVLDRLKRDPTTRHVPVHVVSARDHAQPALALGAVGSARKPVDRAQIAEAVRRLEDRITRTARRVLVVEDDERQRAGIAALLAADGVEIVSVGTAEGALAELSRATFDCVVLDLALPDVTGFELLEKMGAGERYASPPVIVHTGRDLGRDDEIRLLRHSESVIIKGAKSPERLLEEVSLFLHREEARLPPESRRLIEQARSCDAAFEGRRVLLVEDDVRNIFSISHILEPRGVTLEIARNGREALAALDRGPDVDLVLMDLMMPEMDGLTATREIRARPRHARLPVLALTAKAMPDDRERCLAAGASDYLAKPFEVDALLSLCRVWMPP